MKIGKKEISYFLKRNCKNVLIAIDQLVNTFLGSDPDETISSRVGKNYHGTLLEKFINILFWVETKNHCEEAIESDEGKDAIFR